MPSSFTIKSKRVAARSWIDLVHSGGVTQWERAAVAEARTRALNDTRTMWLAILEGWERAWYKRCEGKKPKLSDLNEITYITGEISRLRRALHIPPTPEIVREQTRRRVQAWRERRARAR